MTVGTVLCDGGEHTLRYDGDLVLVDHDLERDLAFQALRDDPPEGCLGVLEAWQGIQWPEAKHDFLEAMLVDDDDIRDRLVKQLHAEKAFAPQIAQALGEVDEKPRVRREAIRRWQLALIALPHSLRVAHCRSLDGQLSHLDDHQLRVALIGEERLADVLIFDRGAPHH